ncbi:hypothetical protein N9D66_00680 [Candidatus Nanopelagicales bacterium]|nr:hypothetical protein [Candidatus Nanopelagicales bacterium]
MAVCHGTADSQVTTPYLLAFVGFLNPYDNGMEPIVWFVTPILVTAVAAGVLWIRDRRRNTRLGKANRRASLTKVGEVLTARNPATDSATADADHNDHGAHSNRTAPSDHTAQTDVQDAGQDHAQMAKTQ